MRFAWSTAIYSAALIVAYLAFVLVALWARPAHAAPLGYSCATVRAAVKTLSGEQLERLARQYKITPEQRREAMACLRKRGDE